jgi:hypothetical protein
MPGTEVRSYQAPAELRLDLFNAAKLDLFYAGKKRSVRPKPT